MTSTPVENEVAAAPVGMGVPFVVASRPQRRFSNTQTVNNLASGGSFAPIPLPATGLVRRVSVYFTAVVTGGTVLAGDGPFRLATGVTLTDATGQPVYQPLNGFNLYLVAKYGGRPQGTNFTNPWENPHMGPEYTYTGTSAVFRLDLDFEMDSMTGYGCIPNLDSNASLQLKIDYAAVTAAFTGATASSLSVRISQEYWAPISGSAGGVAVDTAPPGAGDFLETRYETQVVSPNSENLVTLTNRGGLIKNVLLVSRNAGVRTAVTPGTNFGILLDNQPINEGVTLEEHYDYHRRQYGYIGTDVPVGSFAALTPGTSSGLDVGVVPINFDGVCGGRCGWLNTRAGSLFQLKFTPGAGASTIEVITQLAQVRDHATFFAR